jgi:hypothetical protein
MKSTGVPLTDQRNGVTKRRINLLAAMSGLTHSISGKVTSLGLPLSGVTMTLSTGETTTTNDAGRYSFKGLVDATYTVTPALQGFAFTPLTRTVTVSGANVKGRKFTGTSN